MDRNVEAIPWLLSFLQFDESYMSIFATKMIGSIF